MFSNCDSSLRSRPRLAAGLVLALLLGAMACKQESGAGRASRPAEEAPDHVLLITLDALRADHLGCYGYGRPTSPSIDTLAADGTLFERTQVPRGQTWPALCSLLTGRYPLAHGVRNNGNRIVPGLDLLTTLLQREGYRTGAFLSNFGDAVHSTEDFGLDHLSRTNVASTTPHDQWDDRMTREAVQWITANRDHHTFTWVHLMNPHRPWDPPKAERTLLAPDEPYQGWLGERISLTAINQAIREGRLDLTAESFEEFIHAPYWKPWIAKNYLSLAQQQDWRLNFDQLLDLVTLQRVTLSPSDLGYILSRYDAEVRAADRCVGRLLETVDRLGLSDDTLVIFASDHGDELYDRNHYFSHSSSIFQGVLHVPLIMRWPGRIPPAATVRSLTEITDLLPTILHCVAARAPEGLPGRSLLSLVDGTAGSGPGISFAELAHSPGKGPDGSPPRDGAYAARDDRWKLVRNPSGRNPRKAPYSCLPGRSYPIAREALYDLVRDPGEQRNLLLLNGNDLGKLALDAGEGDPVAAATYLLEAHRACRRLEGELDQWLDSHRQEGGLEQAQQVSEAVRKRLEALGYVEAEPEPPAALPAAGAENRETLLRTALELSASATGQRARDLAKLAGDLLSAATAGE